MLAVRFLRVNQHHSSTRWVAQRLNATNAMFYKPQIIQVLLEVQVKKYICLRNIFTNKFRETKMMECLVSKLISAKRGVHPVERITPPSSTNDESSAMRLDLYTGLPDRSCESILVTTPRFGLKGHSLPDRKLGLLTQILASGIPQIFSVFECLWDYVHYLHGYNDSQ